VREKIIVADFKKYLPPDTLQPTSCWYTALIEGGNQWYLAKGV